MESGYGQIFRISKSFRTHLVGLVVNLNWKEQFLNEYDVYEQFFNLMHLLLVLIVWVFHCFLSTHQPCRENSSAYIRGKCSQYVFGEDFFCLCIFIHFYRESDRNGPKSLKIPIGDLQCLLKCFIKSIKYSRKASSTHLLHSTYVFILPMKYYLVHTTS